MTIELTGTFDRDAARRLKETVRRLGSEAPAVLDLLRVQNLTDAALALLAPVLHEARPQLHIRGLTRHQRRILRYLGVGSSAFHARLASDVES